MNLRLSLACGLLLAAWTGHARGQLIALPERARPSVLGGVGLEPEALIEAGYLQPLAASERALLAIGATLKLAPLVPPRPDLRGALVAAARLRPLHAWQASCALALSLAHGSDDAASLTGLGAELRCQPAWRASDRWAIGLDLGFQSALATYVAHSALARRAFTQRYPEGEPGAGPRDGWYAWTSQRVRLGVSAQHAFSHTITGMLAIGSLFALQDQGQLLAFNLLQVPLYLELGAVFGL